MKTCKIRRLLASIPILWVFIMAVYGSGRREGQSLLLEREISRKLSLMADSLTRHLHEWPVPAVTFRVADYGAVGDGKTVNTVPIQRAIDACSKGGGGRVVVDGGEYVTGTIELKSGVMLEVAEGAKLLGSVDLNDYPDRVEAFESVMSKMHRFRISLIYAEKAVNVGICGKGVIDFRGQRAHFPGPETVGEIEGRPFGIRMVECSNVVIKDITLVNAAAWMQNYLYCNRLILDGIKVSNHANYNNDGIDPDGCRDVIIRNCFVSSHDDAMCFKGASAMPTENVLVENSTFYSTCNAFKFGTDTQGDFRNVVVRNVVLGGIPDSLPSFLNLHECSTGITLETVDGGLVENILMENVEINRSRCPVFAYIGDRGRVLGDEKPGPGFLKNIVIRNVTGIDNRRQGSLVTGMKGVPIENVVVRSMDIGMIGGGTAGMAARSVPERVSYPDALRFRRDGLPAYGFYVRYARNIFFDDVNVRPVEPDGRRMFVAGNSTERVFVNGTLLE